MGVIEEYLPPSTRPFATLRVTIKGVILSEAKNLWFGFPLS